MEFTLCQNGPVQARTTDTKAPQYCQKENVERIEPQTWTVNEVLVKT